MHHLFAIAHDVALGFQALQQAWPSDGVSYAPGLVNLTYTTSALLQQAQAAAAAASQHVLVLGLNQGLESEEHDRVDTGLPAAQLQLLAAVTKAAAGRPVAVVLMSGGQLAVDSLKGDAAVGAILNAF